MTAGSKKCVCGHKAASHRDHRHECDAFLCYCERYLAREDTDGILAALETIDGKATA